MKKLLYNLAIGPRYRRIQAITGPFRQAWADRHGWDYRPVFEVPESVLEGRTGTQAKFALDLDKLRRAASLAEYDLVAYSDTDTFWNPLAPDLAECEPSIPRGGFAAVDVIPYSKRAALFPEWNRDYYVEVESRLGRPLEGVDRTLQINGGLLVYRPREVADRWNELANLDVDLVDEQRLCLYELQNGKVHLLPPDWNVVWQYDCRERLPRSADAAATSVRGRLRRLHRKTLLRASERRQLIERFQQVHVLHLAGENHKVAYLKNLMEFIPDRKELATGAAR